MMKALPFYIGAALFLNAGILKAKETSVTMPTPKTYYISGIAFDTQTYCADYIQTIEALQAEVSRLKKEIRSLRKEREQHLSQKRLHTHRKALKASEKSTQRSTPTQRENRIIISDKPID
jgi:FtsZ-binding cell division protein ZapB